MNELDRIKSDLNIESFDKLSPEQMQAILEKVGKAKYSVEALKTIAPMIPQFATMATEGLKSLREVAATAKAGQERILESIDRNIAILDKIASHPNADKEVLMKLADKAAEIAKDLASLGRSWIDTVKYFGTLAIQGRVAVALVVGAIALGGKPNRA